MPQSLAKVTKHIRRKKGRVTGLHENSRDAKKLRKAGSREERVGKMSSAKARSEEGYVHRVAFFQAALLDLESEHSVLNPSTTSGDSTDAMATDPTFDVAQMRSLIQTYLAQSSASHPSSKSFRSRPELPFTTQIPGRVPTKSAADEKKAVKMQAAEREYASGFWVPDLRSAKTREMLREWEGKWAGMGTMEFVRVDKEGGVHESRFPPRGGV